LRDKRAGPKVHKKEDKKIAIEDADSDKIQGKRGNCEVNM
jgi:hypothetical protein